MTGNKLKELRKKQGLTQSSLAEKTGLRQSTISNIENGADAYISTIIKILSELKAEIRIIENASKKTM
jgi:HTH-type transcriptional regulator/antitoxin HipB